MGQKLYDHSFLILLEIQNKFSFSLRKWQKKNKNQAAAAVFIPNYHGPLKLLNCHGVDGKSWFKKQGPLLALGSDDKVAFTVLPLFFCVYYESYPPSPSSGKKCRNHPWLYALFKHTYNTQILTKKIPGVVQSLMNSFFEKNLGLITQKT